MSQQDNAHAWWSRLRHQGLLLSPVVMLERYEGAPTQPPFWVTRKLRDAYTRFLAKVDPDREGSKPEQNAVLAWADSLLEHYAGLNGRLARQHSTPPELTAAVRIGSRTETLRPHRVVFADSENGAPAILVMADESPRVGRGRGRIAYARFLELLRGTGHRLGLLTNGHQFRLIYAGLDFESWCEWESDRWFDDAEGSEELAGLRQLLSPDSLAATKDGIPSLLDAIEESRKRQADLSSVLRENVRQAVELLLEEVSASGRTNETLFSPLVRSDSDHPLTDKEAHDALLQATVRVVMRMVVCLFAESRRLLPVNDPIYAQSYGVRTLYELLDEAHRFEGGTYGLLNRNTAWPRLMALFRLIYHGSAHGAFPLKAYGGALFRPGGTEADDAVLRALYVLEHDVSVCDATIYQVLRKLLRGPLPVVRGRSKTYVEGPVDYTDLRTEFIGLIYEGLLDYRLKRTDETLGPQVFLNIGREPVLPLARLEDMLARDKKGLRDLLTKLRKEKVTAAVAESEDEEAEDEEEEAESAEEGEEEAAEPELEAAGTEGVAKQRGDYLDADARARQWARKAVVVAGLAPKKRKKESQSEYDKRVDEESNRLIKRVVPVGEFYLVRAGNTRKGTGTFYTRPQLAVPTVHRTLEPLCYDKAEGGAGVSPGGAGVSPAKRIPKKPEDILTLKVCDPACGSASFLVAALHYLTDALYESLRHHCNIEEPEAAKKLTLPYGRPRKGEPNEEIIPFPPDDPQRGEHYAERIRALLRRHVIERCIYGVDINPLAVEFARVSLWIETLDPELPFTFLDHKVKVGNSLVGCWLDRVLDYPIKAWERNGGDDPDRKTKGPRTERIETFLKGGKVGKRRTGDGIIKREMRQVIESRFLDQPPLFPDMLFSADDVVAEARADYERLHEFPTTDPDAREAYYREHVEKSESLKRLTQAMDEWCAVWFWPMDEESAKHAPTPLKFHRRLAEPSAITQRLSDQSQFFHWEIEFPDVFTPHRCGFDAAIGNPPWDVMKPNSQEFFSDYDPIYRTYDKQSALRRQRELFEADPAILRAWGDYAARFKALSNWAASASDPCDMTLARGKDGKALQSEWAKKRTERNGFARPDHPYRLQGSADLNSYKMFAEVFWNLVQSGGRLGVILPTGIYSDFGTKDLRQEFLFRGRLDFLYAFQNEKRVFSAAHHSFKQVALFASRGGQTGDFRARFRMGTGDSPHAQDLPQDILSRDKTAMTFTPEDVRLNSPKTLSLVELKTPRDAGIFRKIYENSIRIGDNASGWEIIYATEFHMTNDSRLFPALEKWEAKSYKPDEFGRWIGPNGEVALPFFQGVSVNQFDIAQKAWLAGMGRSHIWTPIAFDNKRFGPKYLMDEQDLKAARKYFPGLKVGHRRVARSTDTRTTISCVVVGFGCSDKLATLIVNHGDVIRTNLLTALMNSLSLDHTTRMKIGGSLDWNLIEQLPIPDFDFDGARHTVERLVVSANRLTFLHRRFAPEWLTLNRLYPQLGKQQWKHWWAVTEADRLRLRVEIDALCADLYGLEPEDFDWIVRDDPTDPKGFYRVDRNLPFRERLTGLAAAAFWALKDGKWSAETAGELSNEEFFALLGVPELTNRDAARAKGLDAPLIMNRDGCHVWKPENFTEDDPRYGWTWEHCYQDAVTLLGSEEAVEQYINQAKQKTVNEGEPFKLRGDKDTKQGTLF